MVKVLLRSSLPNVFIPQISIKSLVWVRPSVRAGTTFPKPTFWLHRAYSLVWEAGLQTAVVSKKGDKYLF